MHERKNFIVKGKNVGFTCAHCGAQVLPHPTSVRNHCPKCLHSLHVDAEVHGDRSKTCGGVMEPCGLEVDTKKRYRVQHRCLKCGHESVNVAAPDDNFQVLLYLQTRQAFQ